MQEEYNYMLGLFEKRYQNELQRRLMIANKNLSIAFNFREIELWKHIDKPHNIFLYPKYLLQKVFRKCAFWYFNSISENQTHYNNSIYNVTHAFEEITEQQTYDIKLLHELFENTLFPRISLLEDKVANLQADNEHLINELFDSTTLPQIVLLKDRIANLQAGQQSFAQFADNLRKTVDIYSDQLQCQGEYIKQHALRVEVMEHSNVEILNHINNLVEMYHSHNDDLVRMKAEYSTHDFDLARKMTYSQSGEDAIAAYILIMLGYRIQDVTYLDLGANDPIQINNTFLFYSYGAQGVLVEANPFLIPVLKKVRPRDKVVNIVVDVIDAQEKTFYVMNVSSMSTMNEETALNNIKINPELSIESTHVIPTMKLSTIFDKHFGGLSPTLLNIDLEGIDEALLNDFDFERYRPVIIVIEMIDFGPNLMHNSKNRELVKFFLSKEYEEYAFTGINSIFVDQRVLAEKHRDGE